VPDRDGPPAPLPGVVGRAEAKRGDRRAHAGRAG
jgi:hypothetical protein